MDYSDSRQKSHFLVKVLMAAILTALCIYILKQSPGFSGDSVVSFQTNTYMFVDQIMTLGWMSFLFSLFQSICFPFLLDFVFQHKLFYMAWIPSCVMEFGYRVVVDSK